MPVNHDKLGLSVGEAAATLGISRAQLYLLLKEGRGPETVKVGARTLVLASSLQEWLAKQPAYSPTTQAAA